MAGKTSESEIEEVELPTQTLELRFINVPMVRVCELSHENTVDLQIHGNFEVLANDQRLVMDNENPSHKWRIHLQESKPAEYRYSLLKRECFSEKDAEKYAEKLSESYERVWWFQKGTKIYINDNLIYDGIRYWLVEGEWNTREEALKNANIYSSKDVIRIIRKKYTPAAGILELFNIEYDKFTEIHDSLQIVPTTPESTISVINPNRSEKEGDDNQDNLELSGSISIAIGDDGHVIIVSHISLEDYIKRIIPTLHDNTLPKEFIKAFAIAKRGEILYAIAEHNQDDAFDVQWNSFDDMIRELRFEMEKVTIDAVDETKGHFLVHKKTICNSLSTPICGGRTRTGSQVPGIKESSYLCGIIDNESNSLSSYTKNLSVSSNIHKWLQGEPDVFCNRHINYNIPAKFDSLFKYFRWEFSYTRSDLEELINRKLRYNIGIIYDLVPILRKPSGRIETLEILGSLKNVILHGEEQIRSLLNEEMLPSTCFEVLSEVGDDGVPIEFTIRGAGWGSGEGMCLAGAISMAVKGKKQKDILKHYYKNVEIKTIY